MNKMTTIFLTKYKDDNGGEDYNIQPNYITILYFSFS